MNPPAASQSPQAHAPEFALRISNLQYKIGFHRILKGIEFQLKPGESLALLGPNGSGKSTLLKCIAGVLPHTGTKQILDSTLRRNSALRKQIGYVAHETFLYSKLTARENLQFYSNLYQVRTEIDQVLNEFRLLHSAEQLVETFSRGMKQRLALARAMLASPALLLMDEPFTGLDQQGSLFLREKMIEFKGRVALVFATHELQSAYDLCDRVLILKNGEQRFFGDREQIHSDIQMFYQERTL